jgi:hypothetical protein
MSSMKSPNDESSERTSPASVISWNMNKLFFTLLTLLLLAFSGQAQATDIPEGAKRICLEYQAQWQGEMVFGANHPHFWWKFSVYNRESGIDCPILVPQDTTVADFGGFLESVLRSQTEFVQDLKGDFASKNPETVIFLDKFFNLQN